VRAALALGSNLGDRQAHLDRAIAALRRAAPLLALSRYHESDPVGGPPQPRFLNGVALIEWGLGARDLLVLAHRLEEEAGRRRTVRWGPRTLDVDLLLLGDLVLAEADLGIPHPRLAERAFVLAPLAEVAPEWIVPGTGKSVRELHADLALHR